MNARCAISICRFAVGVSLFTALTSGSLAADRIWDGSSSALWTTAANWSNGVAPSPGDAVIFLPIGLSGGSPSNFNNYANGTHFDRIRVASSFVDAHQLYGNRITISNGVIASGAGTVDLHCDLTLAISQTFVSDTANFFFPLTLLLSGTIALNARDLTLEGDGGTTISGTVSTTGSPLISALVKRGLGSLYVAPTGRVLCNIEHVSGSLRVDGVVTNAFTTNGIVIVTGTNAPTLTGTGLVQTAMLGGNGTLNPGLNGPGIMRLSFLRMTYRIIPQAPASAGRLVLELNGTTPGTGHDQLLIENTAFLSTSGAEGQLEARIGYAAQLNDSFIVMQFAEPFGGAGGTFDELGPEGITETTNGYALGLTLYGGDGNDVELKVVRTPGSPFALWKGARIFPPFFSSGTNWVGGTAPAAGSRLRFSRYRNYFLSSAVTNDLPPGTDFATLEIVGTNYTLRGNPLTITAAISNTQNSGVTAIHCDLAIVGPLTIHNDGGPLQIAGSFAGAGTMTKVGSGELRLTGTTSNAFGGSLVLDAGTLRVDGSPTDVAIIANAGLITGTGILSSVTMNGGTLAPGTSPGILRTIGDLTLSPAATLAFELNSPIPGTGYDQLNVAGAVNLNGAALHVSPGYSPVLGTSFLVLINDATDAIQGTFAGLPQGAVFQASNQWFRVSYTGGTGNDVVLTRVNAPATFTGIGRLGDSFMELRGAGGSNLNYTIQANTNLNTTNWLNIGTANSGTGSQFQFLDTNAGLFPMRFYRVVSP